jgi:hypothetical protein
MPSVDMRTQSNTIRPPKETIIQLTETTPKTSESTSYRGEKLKYFELAKTNYASKDSGFKIKGMKSGEEIERVPLDKLELVERREPIVTAAIRVYEETLCAADYEVKHPDPAVKKACMDTLERIRFSGDVHPKLVRHLTIFGNAWNEIVWNVGNDKIMKLDTMDPKYMDLGRDQNTSNILFDEQGRPEYYVQILRWDQKAPESMTVKQGSNDAIKFELDEVMHTKLYTTGDCYLGTGVIEPVFNTIVNKVDIQTGLAQSTLRLGFPTIGARVGSKDIYPTPTMVAEAAEVFKDINESTGFAIPYYYEPILLEPKRSDRVESNLMLFIDQIISGMGVPKSLITGAGEQENKQTLKEIKAVFRLRLKTIQRKIASSIEEQVFTQIPEYVHAKQENEECPIPQLIFSEPSTEAQNEKAERISWYVKSGALTPTPELEAVIRKLEGIEEPTEEKQDNPITE